MKMPKSVKDELLEVLDRKGRGVMKKVDETFRDELPLHHPAYCLQVVIDKVNEIVDWINEQENERKE